ncbi:hypothetical protein Q2420_26030, partial [Escherichia coli]|nr:hypothetical protein [Escherichia coli]
PACAAYSRPWRLTPMQWWGSNASGGCPDHRSPLLDHRHDRENGAEPVLGDPSGPSLATNYKRR